MYLHIKTRIRMRSFLMNTKQFGMQRHKGVRTYQSMINLAYQGFEGHVGQLSQSLRGWRHMMRAAADQKYPFPLQYLARSLFLLQPRDWHVFQQSENNKPFIASSLLKTSLFISRNKSIFIAKKIRTNLYDNSCR